MIWFLSFLASYSVLLVAAPGPTFKVSAVFGGLCGGLLGGALMLEALLR